jgi:23S rRNA pseudouridine955/2504/2580 synthase
MAALGTPIAGDGKYGGRGQVNQGDGWGAGLGGGLSRKLHLHAARLAIPHPISGKLLCFEAPLPEHMLRTWEMMGWSSDPLPKDPFAET